MENVNELETMRQQMAVLKEKLEKQTIISDRMIRRAVRKSTSWIRRRYILSITVALLMIPYCVIVMPRIGLSVGLTVAACAFMLISAGRTYYIMRALNRNFLSEENLVAAGREIARARKMDADWLKFGIPVGCLWLACFCVEAYGLSGNSKAGFYGGLVGAVIGGVVGFKTHMRIQRKYREIIEQIDELTNL